MPQPFIHVTGPSGCFGRRGYPRDPDDCPQGYHAFFYTYIPFVPTFLSADFTRMITGEASRIKLIVMRQIRFLNDLSNCKAGAAETFDLRFVSEPRVGQPFNDITIFFVGKTYGDTAEEARRGAIHLWRIFNSHFPLEDPFNYPLASILEREGGGVSDHDQELLQLVRDPFPDWDPFEGKLIEIRKYEDRDPMLSATEPGQAAQAIGYHPHPFRPTLDFSAMGRFLETFGRRPERSVVSICLRPTTLLQHEQIEINQMMGRYRQLAANAGEAQNWVALYRAERFQDIQRTFEPLINQRNHLFLVKIQVLAAGQAPDEVVAALGSEIMNNATPEPRRWSEVRPASPQESVIAYNNFRLAEFQPWPKPQASPEPLWRMASLVTAYEAVGAFRLPIPPESGHMPGISVRDEPFVLPAETERGETLDASGKTSVPLGKILHRGTMTGTDYLLPLAHLKRHGLITGSTGTGKTNTCLHLLTQLWREAEIAFLVIYPIDKPDYRILRADPDVRDQLLIFTLGDDTTSPFRFNPFSVPPGILVRTHISLLMRAFTAAFSMWDPLPAVYRAALRRTYEDAGFRDLRTAKGGDPGTQAPLFSRFYEILVETAEEMTKDYGREAKGNIRQGSEIRIRDLLLNAGHVLNVHEGAPWDVILKHPTVMEVARVGSVEDGALMMGFLLMSLTSHLASRLMREAKPRQHVTLIEEAHRVMSAHGGNGGDMADARAQASEDFANILAEIRGFNESILIAEQTPTELVTGAIANTYVKIMHWLEEQHSFDLFANIMNLNQQQRDYVRTLPQGHAIVRSPSGRPTLVRVTNYLDQFQHADDSPTADVSDAAIHLFMQGQTARLGVPVPQPVGYQLAAANGSQPHAVQRDEHWTLSLPMQTCALCPALRTSGACRWGRHVRGQLLFGGDTGFLTYCDRNLAAFFAGTAPPLGQLPGDFVRRFAQLTETTHDAPSEILYCYLAHRADDALHGCLSEPPSEASSKRQSILTVLRAASNDSGTGGPSDGG